MEKIHTTYNSKEKRRFLRKNMTQEERILWSCIKNKKLNYIFYRQHSIGSYIVDFYCPAKKFIIELDGEIHNYQRDYDKIRTDYLKALGFNVVRFSNSEIRKNLAGVMKGIEIELNP